MAYKKKLFYLFKDIFIDGVYIIIVFFNSM